MPLVLAHSPHTPICSNDKFKKKKPSHILYPPSVFWLPKILFQIISKNNIQPHHRQDPPLSHTHLPLFSKCTPVLILGILRYIILCTGGGRIPSFTSGSKDCHTIFFFSGMRKDIDMRFRLFAQPSTTHALNSYVFFVS